MRSVAWSVETDGYRFRSVSQKSSMLRRLFFGCLGYLAPRGRLIRGHRLVPSGMLWLDGLCVHRIEPIRIKGEDEKTK